MLPIVFKASVDAIYRSSEFRRNRLQKSILPSKCKKIGFIICYGFDTLPKCVNKSIFEDDCDSEVFYNEKNSCLIGKNRNWEGGGVSMSVLWNVCTS